MEKCIDFIDEITYAFIVAAWESDQTIRKTHLACLANGHTCEIGDVIDVFAEMQRIYLALAESAEKRPMTFHPELGEFVETSQGIPTSDCPF